MTTRGDLLHDLTQAVQAARDAVAEVRLPLPTPSVAAARDRSAAVLAQIDDYLLPRLADPAAPLLVVVGGSTGAGKSTLVNSLARAPVSAAGVLRPTTRSPVLVCHPADAPRFRGGPLLRGVDGGPAGAAPQLISAPALPAGLAFLDAPDIDSAVAANRALAHRLFAAADMWLFLTTANRYADAVPWQLLRTARSRGTVVALVLSRVPAGATDEVLGLLSGLLRDHQLTDVPIFELPETRVHRQGLLPEALTGPLRDWFTELAGDESARTGVIRYTLDGALAALPPELTALAAAADEQAGAAERLAEVVGLAFGVARGVIERGLAAGWPSSSADSDSDSDPHPDPDPGPSPTAPLAAPSAVLSATRSAAPPVAAGRGGARHRQSDAEADLVRLTYSAVADAVEHTDTAWRSDPVGAALLANEIVEPTPDLPRQLQRIAREHAPEQWPARIDEILDTEAARWLRRLAGVTHDGLPARQLREAGAALERARLAAQLTAPTPDPAGPANSPAVAAAPTTLEGQQ